MFSVRTALMSGAVCASLVTGAAVVAPTATAAQPPAASVASGGALAGVPTAGMQAVGVQAAVRTRSGLPWESGAFTRHSDSNRRSLEQFRGLPLDIVDVHPTRDTWSTLLNPWWIDAYTAFPGRLAIAMPLWPRNGSLAKTRYYDDEWRTFGRLLVRRGHGDAYIRLGWEFNLHGQYWRATDGNARAWVSAFRRAVTAIRSTAPGVKIIWNPNEGPSQSLSDARAVWPGVGYVDAVGIDAYDWYRPVEDWRSWRAERTENGGWQYWMSFARAKGKKFALPEWGVYSGSRASGGDNAYYIRAVLRWLYAYRSDILYESYFNETAIYCGCAVVPTRRNPDAAAAYRATLRDMAR